MTHQGDCLLDAPRVKGHRAGVGRQARHWPLPRQGPCAASVETDAFQRATARAPRDAAARQHALRRGKQAVASGREASRWVDGRRVDGRVTDRGPDRRQHINVCYPALAEADKLRGGLGLSVEQPKP